ncbi:MAG: VWA domain-containing protein [Solidesulfovibrio sp. DCME]|uniref:BatD family protein n=1 Tax=Solidesulfovibrio sp. DCME TaxID=3447380 RepID=UPI003D0C01E0
MLAAFWAIGILAVSGPTWKREPTPFTQDAAALVIVLKVTPTMLAKDIQPSRLVRATQKIHDLLKLRPGAKAALVAYAGSSHLVMPFTVDPNIIDMFSQALDPDVMPGAGDDPLAALTQAAALFQKAGLGGSILLVADSLPPSQLAKMGQVRRDTGIAVHFYAMAAPKGVRVPADSPPAPPLNPEAWKQAAATVGADLTVVTVDDADVAELARRIPAAGQDRFRQAGGQRAPGPEGDGGRRPAAAFGCGTARHVAAPGADPAGGFPAGQIRLPGDAARTGESGTGGETMSRRIALLGLFLVAAVLAATRQCPAAGQPVLLQSELRQPDKIWVGQRLDLLVTLLTTSSFAGVPRFDLPKDAGLAIMADDAQPILGTTTIDGVAYMSKQYDISLFPLRSGTLTLPAFAVEFGYLGDAGQEVDTSLTTTAAPITVLDVPGADPKLPFVTATDLNIADQWDPNPGKAAVGDAFTRTITMRATGLPGLALPPLRLPSSDGLAVYARQPRVATDTARGDYIGKRVEVFSLVCQKAGTYTLPEMRIQWWNPATAALRQVKLPPVTLQVAPNPLLDAGAPPGVAGGHGRASAWWWAAAAVFFVGAGTGGVWLLRNRHRPRARADAATEKALFRQFQRAAASQNAPESMRALTRWFDAADPSQGMGGLSECIDVFGDPELQRQFAALEACLYGKEKVPWSGDALARRVAAMRKALRRRRLAPRGQGQALGPLNPSFFGGAVRLPGTMPPVAAL